MSSLKVVVAVKSVGTLADEFELLADGSGVDPADLEISLNEWDDFALEAALRVREVAGDGQVLAVTLGDEESEAALLGCLAKGADHALRIWDEDLAHADPLAVARVLAAAVEGEDADLILCGVQSSDAVNGATGVALAGFLGLPSVAVVRHLEYDLAEATVTVERELEGGLVELVRMHTPALLTIQSGINQPRYANLRAIKQAREKPMDVRTLDELGLDSAALAVVAGSRSRGLRLPERGEGAEMLGGSASDVAERIAEIVRERMVA
jgi:electron transfer flavoprotein beta subunit